jgi:ferric-dicitrate binding protein FerR (iron transport regulator)
VNEQQKFELFENTEVTLFPGAEIAYDSRIKNKVQLKGKAAFTIDSKTSVDGIVIQAGETFIKDIGTVFTVDATASDKIIIVEVTEGEVLFYTNTNSGVSVKANQTAIYDADIKQFSIIVETERPPSLQEIVFHNASFRNVIDIIQARYGVNIIVNTNQFNEMMLNVDFNPDESIEYVLDIITATISAQWSKKGNNYIIIPEN